MSLQTIQHCSEENRLVKTLPPEIWEIILKDDVLKHSSGLLRNVCRLFRNILHNNCKLSTHIICSVSLIKWAYTNGCPWDASTCANAAMNGHLEVLQWARANGCPWDVYTCAYAAINGRLEVLQWARSNGCPWDYNTIIHATWQGHDSVVEWAKSHGCPSQ